MCVLTHACMCVWQPHLFMTNCSKPGSHMAMGVFTISVGQNPILQIDSYSFPKKWHFKSQFLNRILNQHRQLSKLFQKMHYTPKIKGRGYSCFYLAKCFLIEAILFIPQRHTSEPLSAACLFPRFFPSWWNQGKQLFFVLHFCGYCFSDPIFAPGLTLKLRVWERS